MITAAIVEDQKQDADLLEKMLGKYGEEAGMPVVVHRYPSAVSFLEHYDYRYDIVFLDINMPYMDGIACAAKLREADPSVILIFITNLTQYAAIGYEYDALDYILKPVTYPVFRLKMARILKHMDKSRDRFLLVSNKDHTYRIDKKSLRYIETEGHLLVFHTTDRLIRQYGSLSSVEKKLDPKEFVRCNACYLVNLAYITELEESAVYLDTDVLRISKGRKKQFLDAYRAYAGRYEP